MTEKREIVGPLDPRTTGIKKGELPRWFTGITSEAVTNALTAQIKETVVFDPENTMPSEKGMPKPESEASYTLPPQNVEGVVKKRTHSKETKRKMSQSKIGIPLSENHVSQIKKGKKGTVISPDHAKKISEAKKGKTHTDQSRKNMTEGQRKRRIRETIEIQEDDTSI